MSPEEFFEHFLKELAQNERMNHYYKFLGDAAHFQFRKSYFLQRLHFIKEQVGKGSGKIYDCGCGYGTTCIFLALNGIETYGETLEFYYDEIKKRTLYWSSFGDMSLFSYGYENLFDLEVEAEKYQTIIVQDTLHHLEPIGEALSRLSNMLKPGGKMIVVEENGNNIIQSALLFKRRGNKRITEIWDERLQKKILLGNENIRSLKQWTKLLGNAGLNLRSNTVQYIRYFLPRAYKRKSAAELLKKEQALAAKHPLLRERFFFGINFVLEKP